MTWVADQIREQVPVDLSAVPIVALVPAGPGGCWAEYPGRGTADGRFSISGLPSQTYYLRCPWFKTFGGLVQRTTFVAGAATALDLGFVDLGRPDHVPVDEPGTLLELNITGLAPWRAGDALWLSSFDAPTLLFLDRGHPLPGPGATEVSALLVDYTDGVLPFAIDGGTDRAWLLQAVEREDVSGRWLELSRGVAVEAFSVKVDGTTRIDAALAPTRSRTVLVDWRRSEFVAVASGLSSGEDGRHSLEITDRIHSEEASWHWGEALLHYEPEMGTPDSVEVLSYGTVFPSQHTELISAYYVVRVVHRRGATAWRTSLPQGVTLDLSREIAPVLLRPKVGPVRNITINGQASGPHLADLQDVGPTPLVSWDAPELGEPSSYIVRLSGLGEPASTTIHTLGRSVHVPPGILERGQPYIIVIEANQYEGTASGPLKRPVAFASSTAATGVVVP